MSKLHIPHPEQSSDFEFGAPEVAVILAIILALAIIGFFHEQGRPPDTGGQTLAEIEAAEIERKLDRESKRQLKLARKLNKLKQSELESRAWTAKELTISLKFGSRAANEAACRGLSKDKPWTLDDATRIEFLKAIDRRAKTAPFSCLSRLFFAGKLSHYKDVEAEFEELWSAAEAYDDDIWIVGSAVEEFRKTRNRPESPRFYSWLRMCALNMDYAISPTCQQLVSSIRPAQGADMLGTLQMQLQSGERPEDIPIMIHALGFMARNGSPPMFQVKETKELPDYEVDFLHGTLFNLCRFMYTPDPKVSELAASELGDVSGFGARGFDRKLQLRWRETCRIAFKKGDQDPLKILAVWDGNPEHKAIYSLKPEIDGGLCVQEEGYPEWWCGAKLWNGEGKPLKEGLGIFFVETRRFETQDWE